MQICFHKLKNEIKISSIIGLDNFMKCYDILMVQLRQNGHLSIGPLCIDIILERIKYLFECIFFLCDSVFDFPNVAIGSTS